MNRIKCCGSYNLLFQTRNQPVILMILEYPDIMKIELKNRRFLK